MVDGHIYTLLRRLPSIFNQKILAEKHVLDGSNDIEQYQHHPQMQL